MDFIARLDHGTDHLEVLFFSKLSFCAKDRVSQVATVRKKQDESSPPITYQQHKPTDKFFRITWCLRLHRWPSHRTPRGRSNQPDDSAPMQTYFLRLPALLLRRQGETEY